MRAMVLAAGLGQRMRPLTNDTAKPLLMLRGRSLLDHALDRLHDSGVTQAVVNAHWKAERVVAAMAGRKNPRVRVQLESELLETGGGVRQALPLLGEAPFPVVNGDAYWLDGPTPALTRLLRGFDPARMDALLLLVRTTQVEGEVGRGDFLMDGWGRLARPPRHVLAPYIFSGIQILAPGLVAPEPVAPGLVAPEPVAPFSLNRCYDSAAAAGRLFGLVHDGLWFHLSTPPDLVAAEQRLRMGFR